MIGIFDSGVGGLASLLAVREVAPRADLIYYADEANLPYGEKNESEICRIAETVCARLLSEGASVLLAACGTVSSVALPYLQKRFSVPIFGIVEPTAQAVRDTGIEGDILILATEASIRAGAFIREIADFATHAPRHTLACPDFVPMAEEGRCDLHNPDDRAEAERILAPVMGHSIGTAVLGCTHFSLLRDLIGVCLPGVCLVDAAREGARAMLDTLSDRDKEGRGECRLLTSGDPDAFLQKAKRILEFSRHTGGVIRS